MAFNDIDSWIFQLLRMMVGINISDEELRCIADRTFLEADEDNDSYISFEEFRKVRFSRFEELLV